MEINSMFFPQLIKTWFFSDKMVISHWHYWYLIVISPGEFPRIPWGWSSPSATRCGEKWGWSLPEMVMLIVVDQQVDQQVAGCFGEKFFSRSTRIFLFKAVACCIHQNLLHFLHASSQETETKRGYGSSILV